MNFETNFGAPKQESNNQEKIVLDKNEGQENSNEKKESVNDVISGCLNQMKSGEEVAKALKNIGQEAIDGGLQQRQLAWEQAAKSISLFNRFSSLENASAEELEEAYLKYFEAQDSEVYLGKVLTSLDSLAFREGFFNVYNDKSSENLSPNILQAAKIAEKLVAASKRVNKEKGDLNS